MNTDLITTDTITDHVPLDRALSAVDELVTDTVPEFFTETVPGIVGVGVDAVNTGVHRSTDAIKGLRNGSPSRTKYYVIGATVVGLAVIALLLWRRRASSDATQSGDDWTAGSSPRAVA